MLEPRDLPWGVDSVFGISSFDARFVRIRSWVFWSLPVGVGASGASEPKSRLALGRPCGARSPKAKC